MSTSVVRTLPLLGAAAMLLGCPSPDPRAPIDLPNRLDPVAVDRCAAVTVEVFMGPAAPLEPTDLSATCENPEVCEAEVRDRSTVIAHGKNPGETFLYVQYTHPGSGEHVAKRIAVTFTAPPAVDALHPRIANHDLCNP